jgi:HAMP domain-containing protein
VGEIEEKMDSVEIQEWIHILTEKRKTEVEAYEDAKRKH